MVVTRFLTIGQEVTHKPKEEARMIPMVMDQSQRYKYELMFSSIQIQMVTYRNISRYVYIPGLVYSYFLALSTDRSQKQLYLISNEYSQCPDLSFQHHSPTKGKRTLRKKQLTAGLGQEIHKMILEHLVGSENKEILKHIHTHTHN